MGRRHSYNFYEGQEICGLRIEKCLCCVGKREEWRYRVTYTCCEKRNNVLNYKTIVGRIREGVEKCQPCSARMTKETPNKGWFGQRKKKNGIARYIKINALNGRAGEKLICCDITTKSIVIPGVGMFPLLEAVTVKHAYCSSVSCANNSPGKCSRHFPDDSEYGEFSVTDYTEHCSNYERNIYGRTIAVISTDGKGKHVFFPSIANAADRLGVRPSDIIDALKNQEMLAGGRKWSYHRAPRQ